ncbi:hypothetical protein [Candidatus Marinarcus aquaticus]|uniref:Uncharacterized protein n=1 Tax=Candidatus Marinarcus aquaticus TaxID=2044504 RepID=A0A4Q0XU57_9BACT|nr:hypothetical protein [Candidatus Marinarcus aquaticus]RXJ60044.1 hypothetical protein CRV04_03260 [Candidatus Marinarcus aquaticus]
MATPMEFIKANELDWQPSLNADLSDGLHGYRGALIVEAGKQISPDRKLPPKIQAKQVIMISKDEKIKFFSCELESFHHFKPMMEKYGQFFDADSLVLLYVTDLDANGTFEYKDVTITAIMLDESSVWNELLEVASLDKSDMKAYKKAEEKIEKLYEELLDSDVKETPRTYDEMCSFIGESSKQLMGAV